MNELVTPALNPPAPPVAIFGIDEAGRVHASRFPGDAAELATKAAALMHMHVLPLAGPECDGIADQLAQGRIFPATGKAFVPFCKQPLYERLAALGGVPAASAVPKAEKAAKPPKATKGAAKAETTKKPDQLAAAAAAPVPDVEASGVPTDWPIIIPGSLVLATSGAPADGWFESVVVEAKADDLMVLRWRDYPDEALFLRRRDQLGLLPAGTPLAKG